MKFYASIFLHKIEMLFSMRNESIISKMNAEALNALTIIEAQENSAALIDYIKNYNLDGGFMFGRTIDHDKQLLSKQLDDLLDVRGIHSGASWGTMMRTIQGVYNGIYTREQLM